VANNEVMALCERLEIQPSVYSALKNSLYPGAKNESIEMVIQYCKAAGLDPMLKPVHIVPMSVKDATTGKYEYRDVIMPGIGLYRIQASRSNRHAGTTEPEFGDIVTQTLGGVTVAYPEWCKVVVKKRGDDGNIYEFAAKEYWIENYARKDKDSVAPNAMWAKRVYAQLAKCAEAQALRKAFPELGSQPTAEEMEGKVWDQDEIIGQSKTSEKMTLLEEKLANRPKQTDKPIINNSADLETKIKETNHIDNLMKYMTEINAIKDFKEKKRHNEIFNIRMKELKDGISPPPTKDDISEFIKELED
jgi:phage recombination protein Bet